MKSMNITVVMIKTPDNFPYFEKNGGQVDCGLVELSPVDFIMHSRGIIKENIETFSESCKPIITASGYCFLGIYINEVLSGAQTDSFKFFSADKRGICIISKHHKMHRQLNPLLGHADAHDESNMLVASVIRGGKMLIGYQ